MVSLKDISDERSRNVENSVYEDTDKEIEPEDSGIILLCRSFSLKKGRAESTVDK